jgi:hypothetical protein
MRQVKSESIVRTGASITPALVAEASETETGSRRSSPGKPSCPGCWEILVELGDAYEHCILCGERREIGA